MAPVEPVGPVIPVEQLTMTEGQQSQSDHLLQSQSKHLLQS